MINRILFLLGLVFILVGQILLAQGIDWVYSQKPIDFAHWFLLIGALCLLPQVFDFPAKIFSYIGKPLTIIGIAAFIGMCVLDFIFWSFPNEEARQEFANHIIPVSAIWKPFITIGPSSKIFNLGLLLLALNYWKEAKLGLALVFLADLILWHLIPLPYRLVFGYAFSLIGFALIFYKLHQMSVAKLAVKKAS
ncbi:MAG: hypothetical protein ACPGVV_08880 [Croceimicrobium sp.]|nr:hypothetical protein [Bacteroidota bacterium]